MLNIHRLFSLSNIHEKHFHYNNNNNNNNKNYTVNTIILIQLEWIRQTEVKPKEQLAQSYRDFHCPLSSLATRSISLFLFPSSQRQPPISPHTNNHHDIYFSPNSILISTPFTETSPH